MTKSGWNGESQRHGMAAKGVKTNAKNNIEKAKKYGDYIDVLIAQADDINTILPDIVKLLEFNGFKIGRVNEADSQVDAGIRIKDTPYHIQLSIDGEMYLWKNVNNNFKEIIATRDIRKVINELKKN